jgi:hypothetical protein
MPPAPAPRALLWLCLLLSPLWATACDDDQGNLGGDCRDDRDCGSDLFCCTTKACKNICTQGCASDGDCPNSDMLCHSKDYCLFRCVSDRDCPSAYKCKGPDGAKVCTGD